jgi:hypothetical protein
VFLVYLGVGSFEFLFQYGCVVYHQIYIMLLLRRAREWESEAKVGIRVGRGGSLWVGNRTGVEDGSEKMGDFEKK